MSYITYNKKCFQVILFENKSNDCPVQEFLSAITNKKLKSKIYHNIQLLQKYGYLLGSPFSKYLKNGIYELWSKQSTNIVRLFYFFDDTTIILTNGYVKKTNKLKNSELQKAINYRNVYFARKESKWNMLFLMNGYRKNSKMILN